MPYLKLCPRPPLVCHVKDQDDNDNDDADAEKTAHGSLSGPSCLPSLISACCQVNVLQAFVLCATVELPSPAGATRVMFSPTNDKTRNN